MMPGADKWQVGPAYLCQWFAIRTPLETLIEEIAASLYRKLDPNAQPPLADEGRAAGRDRLGRGRVDHVGVISGDLVVQALGRVGE
jgi:hypothetical protein